MSGHLTPDQVGDLVVGSVLFGFLALMVAVGCFVYADVASRRAEAAEADLARQLEIVEHLGAIEEIRSEAIRDMRELRDAVPTSQPKLSKR